MSTVKPSTLEALFRAQSGASKRYPQAVRREIANAVLRGVMRGCDVDDLMYGLGVVQGAEVAKDLMRPGAFRAVYYKPKRGDKSTWGSDGLSLDDALCLVVKLRHLGLPVEFDDAALLADVVKAGIGSRKYITGGEVDALWLNARWSQMKEALYLNADGDVPAGITLGKFITPAGYTAEYDRERSYPGDGAMPEPFTRLRVSAKPRRARKAVKP